MLGIFSWMFPLLLSFCWQLFLNFLNNKLSENVSAKICCQDPEELNEQHQVQHVKTLLRKTPAHR